MHRWIFRIPELCGELHAGELQPGSVERVREPADWVHVRLQHIDTVDWGSVRPVLVAFRRGQQLRHLCTGVGWEHCRWMRCAVHVGWELQRTGGDGDRNRPDGVLVHLFEQVDRTRVPIMPIELWRKQLR